MITFLLFDHLQKKRDWLFVNENLILLLSSFTVLHVNFHYYVGICEGVQVRY